MHVSFIQTMQPVSWIEPEKLCKQEFITYWKQNLAAYPVINCTQKKEHTLKNVLYNALYNHFNGCKESLKQESTLISITCS